MNHSKILWLLGLFLILQLVLPTAQASYWQPTDEWEMIANIVPRQNQDRGHFYSRTGRYDPIGAIGVRYRQVWDPGVDRRKGGPASRVNYINPYWW